MQYLLSSFAGTLPKQFLGDPVDGYRGNRLLQLDVYSREPTEPPYINSFSSTNLPTPAVYGIHLRGTISVVLLSSFRDLLPPSSNSCHLKNLRSCSRNSQHYPRHALAGSVTHVGAFIPPAISRQFPVRSKEPLANSTLSDFAFPKQGLKLILCLRTVHGMFGRRLLRAWKSVLTVPERCIHRCRTSGG